MLIFSGVYEWEGFGGQFRLAAGKCRLWIFDLRDRQEKATATLRPYVIIATDLADSPMSVRSCSGHIATRLAVQYRLSPQRMLFVEYYPAVSYGENREHLIPERFDAVEFTWRGDKALHPKWRTLQPPLLDQVKGLLEEAPGFP